MLICVSANPALDRRVRVRDFRMGAVNRVESSVLAAGGKAAHVAMVAAAIGEDVAWLGFAGGTTGDELVRQLGEFRIRIAAVPTAAATRINDEIIHEDGRITEVLERGGPVSRTELDELRRRLAELTGQGAVVAISGSLPPGAPDGFCAELAAAARDAGATVFLDTSGAALGPALGEGPDLVKPNREEAAAFAGFPVVTETDAARAAASLIAAGARSAAVSLGGAGSVWTDGKSALRASAPPVEVVSTVGCGDAFLAGMATAARRGLSPADALRLAAACGSANCLAELPGRVAAETIGELEKLVRIDEIGLHL